MIINHNMAAVNTLRQMDVNAGNSTKSLQKLSSGLRINNAADDAAGLAISEKMRGQIRGLDQAGRNAQDGISMIQTAEGSLTETHSILQRMKELATQSANDTNTTSDRGEIQKEMNQLTSEVNRIGNTTEFNTQKLLNGGGKDVSVVNAGKLTVPAQLSGGQASTNNATAGVGLVKTFTLTNGFDPTAVTGDNGKTITFNIGGKDINLTLNSSLIPSNSTASQVGISTAAAASTATTSADAIQQALTLAVAADNDLRGKYTIDQTSDAVIKISANALSFNNGQLSGTDVGVKGSVSFSTSTAFKTATVAEAVVTAGEGAFASATIDFTGKTAADLKNTGFVVGGKKVDLYDSTDGAYTGNADFAVDLKGLGSATTIVDKVVSALYNTTNATVSKFGVSVATGASYLPDVYVSKDSTNANQLLITSKKAGIAGNDIKLDDNSRNDVSNVVGSSNLTNESVVSAKGLKDGQQTVTVNYKAAGATEMAKTAGTTDHMASAGVSITSTTSLDSGTYRLTNAAGSTLDHVQLQKLGSDGTTWDAVAGYGDIVMTGAASVTVGDLAITGVATGTFTAAAANTDVYQFTIDKQHYEATLTEKDGTAGASVRVASGQQGVTLKAQDGVGEAVVNIGDVSSDLSIGANTTFSFNTSAAKSTEVIGGKFEATFQVGANTAQSMTVEINDMRAQSLKISGTSAGGSVTATNGTVATLKATAEVTDGTNNTSTEYALDVSTHDKATAAISVLDDAIQGVSAERSKIGAYQNRLEHTINNLGTSSENLTAAESRVRDVDMAKEMTTFKKNDILNQAAQAMLAQANQQPQGVLQLLR